MASASVKKEQTKTKEGIKENIDLNDEILS